MVEIQFLEGVKNPIAFRQESGVILLFLADSERITPNQRLANIQGYQDEESEDE
jgi:hypothetical protein